MTMPANQQFRGQASAEMMIILAIAGVVLLALLSIYDNASSRYGSQSDSALATAAVHAAGDSIEAIHLQAVGSRTRVYLTLPQSVQSVIIGNRTFGITYGSGTGHTAYRTFGFNVTGNVTPTGGALLLLVESLAGEVLITQVGS